MGSVTNGLKEGVENDVVMADDSASMACRSALPPSAPKAIEVGIGSNGLLSSRIVTPQFFVSRVCAYR